MRVIYSPAHLGHDVVTETVQGLAIPANEVAERAERIRHALEADGGFAIEPPTEHGNDPILAVHAPGLVRFIDAAWPSARAQALDRPNLIADTFPTFRMFEGMSAEFVASRAETRNAAGRAGWWGLDTANPLVAGTAHAAHAAVDVALTTVDLVLGGERVAYGLCRPPGHHAGRSMAGGYCFFNNAAIAAEAIARQTGERVAILDVDYHHGNGTQQIFWSRGDVLYVSLHADPDRAYPYFTGFADERGAGAGAGATLNLALDAGCDDNKFLDTLTHAVDVVDRFEPDLVVVSLGVDTYGGDPLGDLAVTDDAYHPAGLAVAAIDRPLVVVQEGGYAVGAMGGLVRSFLRGAARLPVNLR